MAFNSSIEIFRSIPLTENSEDTLYFQTRSAQNSYFSGATPLYSASSMKFVRGERQAVIVDCPYATIYNANYLRFKNGQSYGNKWMYAFINEIKYVNDECTEVTFTIDVLQTWLPNIDYNLTECFIKRETPADDAFGDNIEPENVDVGELIDQNYQLIYKPSWPPLVALMLQAVPQGLISSSGFQTAYDKVINGYVNLIFDFTNATDSANYRTLMTSIDSSYILGLYMIPGGLINISYDCTNYSFGSGELSELVFHKLKPNKIGMNESVTVAKRNYGTLDGYTPNNMKMFTFPFNALKVFTNEGINRLYRYEKFDGPCKFNVSSTVSLPMSIISRPMNYMGSSGNTVLPIENTDTSTETGINPEQSIVLNTNVAGGYSCDTFKAYLQNQLPSLIGGAMMNLAGTQPSPSGIASAATGAIGDIISFGTSALQQARYSVRSQNQQCAINNDWGHFYIGVVGCQTCLDFEHARKIDEYFTAYGYAINRIKTPNIYCRTRFTYVQTVGAGFYSVNVPSADMKKINAMYDNGLRFWSFAGNLINHDLTSSNPIFT